jgi:hypothetical protein
VSLTSRLYAPPNARIREPFKLFILSFKASMSRLTVKLGISPLMYPAISMSRGSKLLIFAFQSNNRDPQECNGHRAPALDKTA